MTFTVSIASTGQTFSTSPEQSILSAALEAGIILPYACNNGGCGTCKAKVLNGVHQTRSTYLTEDERAQGYALLCSSFAQSDVLIETKVLQGLADVQVKKIPTRIKQMRLLCPDVMELSLQLPANQSFHFVPGQFVDVLLENGVRRSYSIANLPGDGTLVLHVRHVPGGLFTDRLFAQSPTASSHIKEKAIMRLEGPLGTFYVRDDSKPIIFLASGTGFAPIQSMLHNMLAHKTTRNIHLYWGARHPLDLYAHELCQHWQTTGIFSEHGGKFTYTPVISEVQSMDAWSGQTGFVHEAMLTDYPNLAEYVLYACGSPKMIEAAKSAAITQAHLPEDAFFADAFLNASHTTHIATS